MNLFKNGGRLLVFLAALALIFVFGACDGGEDGDPDNGIDYGNYNTNYAILVRNETSQNLVAFKGALAENLILGGIRPGTQALKKNPTLFTKSEDFAMILLTEDQYLTNKKNLKVLENTPFTRVYVFYNHTGENDNHYVISERVGGANKLVIYNNTGLNAELRLNGIGGETIGYATKDMLSTTLYVSDGDLAIFPVFKRYNSLRDTIDTLYPKQQNGNNLRYFYGFEPTPGGKEETLNLGRNILDGQEQTTGVAWLVINNATNPNTSIRVLNGTTPVRTTAGVSLFNAPTKTFQIDMPNIGTGGQVKFADSVTIGGFYSVGVLGEEVAILDEDGNNVNLTLQTDMQYTVVVQGNYQNEGLTATIIMSEGKANSPKRFGPSEVFAD